MSDTPRTDAQCYGDGRHPYVPTEFARQLERELAEARQSLEFQMQLNREVIELEKRTHSELAAERALADRLAATLRFIDEECDWEAGGDHWHGSFGDDRIGPACEEALSTWRKSRNEAGDPP